MWPVVEVIAERDVAKDCRGSMAVLQRTNANEGHPAASSQHYERIPDFGKSHGFKHVMEVVLYDFF